MREALYVRTERGNVALNDPLAKLDPWLKHALRLIDGQRDLAAIGRSCPAGTVEKLVATLTELGLAQRVGAIENTSAMTQPMPIVTEMPPAPEEMVTVPVSVGLRSLARPPASKAATGAHRPLTGERLNDVKTALARAFIEHAGKHPSAITVVDIARRICAAPSAMDLPTLVTEAQAFLARHVGEDALAAFGRAAREQGHSANSTGKPWPRADA